MEAIHKGKLVGVVIPREQSGQAAPTEPETLTLQQISDFVLALAARILQEMSEEAYDGIAAIGREHGQRVPYAEVFGAFRLRNLQEPTWIVDYSLAGMRMPLVVYWRDGQLHECLQEQMKV